jgi:hypothetical protein
MRNYLRRRRTTSAAMPAATATSPAVAISFSINDGGNASAKGRNSAVMAPAMIRKVLS